VAAEYFIGLMSGTSRDGMDAAIVELDETCCSLVCARTTPFPDSVSTPLARLVESAQCGLEELGRLDVRIGEFAAECVAKLLDESGIPAERVMAIGFSGHTVFHHPEPPEPFTLQLGNANVLAAQTGITTVADLRGMDVAVGGQGAPLLPAFHAWRFSDPNEPRVVVNIGGIANLTCLVPYRPVIGFDSGPGNTLMDAWCRRHAVGAYDENGRWAASGSVIADLLGSMLADPYFDREPPKSTGLEHFNSTWLARHLTSQADAKPEDVQATLLELTTRSIAQAAQQLTPDLRRLIVCGGGAYNGTLMSSLRTLLPLVTIEMSDTHGIAPEWVEAMGFAWFAQSRLIPRPANLPSVTGARERVHLGGVYSGAKLNS
jgi:anhydro-N-acetylmuramic acid kinase